jgi:hypothetical protein
MAIYPPADQSHRYDGLFPMSYTSGPWKGLVHSTEGMTLPGYESGKKAPHFTLLPNLTAQTVRWFQHFDTARPSRALASDPTRLPDTNREKVVQIELVGTCDPAHRVSWTLGTRTYRAGADYVFWPDAPRWLLDELAVWMRWVEATHGVARVSTPRPWLPYPSSYGATRARMTGPEWDAFSGWCGHQHAPENAHGDPGDIDITYLLAPTTSEEDIMATLEELRVLIREEVMDALVQRQGGMGGDTSLRTTLAYLDANLATAKDPTRITDAVTAAVAAIAPEVSASALAAEIIRQLAS